MISRENMHMYGLARERTLCFDYDSHEGSQSCKKSLEVSGEKWRQGEAGYVTRHKTYNSHPFASGRRPEWINEE